MVDQLDVKNAFLNGNLDEEIYMYPPEGLDIGQNLVCRLKKTLYGLRQAPREWNKRFDNFVRDLGFQPCNMDRCMYVFSDESCVIYLLLYVDDVLLAGSDRTLMDRIKGTLTNEFKMRDLGEFMEE